MKSIATILFAAGIALLVVERVSAQDAAAPFRRILPSPTPEPTAKPTPTPKPKPTPKPRPSPSATTAPTPTPVPESKPSPSPAPESIAAEVTPTPLPKRASEEKPWRRVLHEKPVRAVEPRQPFIRRIPAEKRDGPSLYKPTFDLSRKSNWITNAAIRSMENKWQHAVKTRDVDALDKLLDEDFVGTSENGKRASKARMLRELRNDKNVYRSVRVGGTSVRTVRPGVMVITGTITESGTKEDGERFTNSRRFSDTWKERNRSWVCTASEVTAISKP